VPGLWLLLTGRAQLPAFDYWYRATRIIPHTINEFPFFSFLFADLHPHMIGIPFTVLAVALFLVLIHGEAPGRVGAVARWLVVALVVGALGVINTWDLPTYLGVLGCVLVYRGWKARGLRGIVVGAITSLLVAAISLALYSPFFLHYRTPDLSLALVPPPDRTHLSRFMTVWGLQLFLVISLVSAWAVRDRPWRRLLRLGRGSLGQSPCSLAGSRRPIVLRWALRLAALVLITALIWLLRDMLVAALLAVLLAFTGILLLASGRNETVFLQRLMLFVGLGLLLGVEVVYLRDWLAESEWRRMNTVFKFYIQAWVLIGLASGAALPEFWRRIMRRRRTLALVWSGALALLVVSSLAYLVMGIPARVTERFPGAHPPIGTLDGTAYMRTAIYHWPDQDHPIELKYDREAVQWLLRHVEGTPVIAEAPLGYYRAGGLRVSAYTGLPTIVGAHQREQRPMDQVSAREGDAAELYRTTDTSAMLDILRRYRVRYVYVGQLERNVYPGPGLAKFEELTKAGTLARVFHNDRVDIYEVSCDWDADC
jgi:YYY domain-containing protein